MQRRDNTGDRGYGLTFEIRILLAEANLLLEEVWRRGRLFFCIIGLFIGLSLLDFWSFTANWLHIAALALFAIAGLYSLFTGLRRFRLPSRKRALRYLERRNELSHRPLQSLGGHSEAEKLNNTSGSLMWRIYQKSLRRYVNGLKVGFPNLDMGSEDGYGLRAVIILLLVAAVVIAGPRSGERLYAAVTPTIGTPEVPVDVTAWVTPPAYTGRAPILLNKLDSEEAPVKTYIVPAQSSFIAHVFGGGPEAPSLILEDQSEEFTATDAQNFQIQSAFDNSTTVRIEKDGEVIAHWRLTIVVDELPAVDLISDPEVTDRAAFKLQYQATDDYGVMQIGGEISRGEDGEKIELGLPTPGRGSKQIVSKSYHDLTAHPWAGLPVTLTLFAEDQIGQKGYSEPLSFVLPERKFTHPVAKALIEQRKNLVTDPEANAENVALVLEAIAGLPNSFNNDVTVILALSTARAILANGVGQESFDEVIELLWDTALRLENGDLSQAEAALRAAQEALMEALNNNASDEEIKRLVEELRAAMDNFLQALAQQQRPMDDPAAGDPNSQDQFINSQDLQKMLDRIDQFARGGARDAARQLLSELQDIMENLKNAEAMPPSASQQAGQQMLNELGKLMQKQRELLDQTFRQSQGRQPQQGDRRGQQPGQQPQNGQQQGQQGQQGQSGQRGNLQDLAQVQEAIRQMLGDLMGRIGENGEIPESLGQAERSMNDARGALEQGQGQSAMESESNALESLRQGTESLAQQMMQNGEGQGQQQAGPGQPGQGRDPLGRSMEQDGNEGSISDGAMLRGESEGFSKSRDIRNELQRRLSDPARPLLERDYLRRLLDIF
ncbi:TIGR02302 family protein [Sneathiella chungangensis]|uniref:TIGR02302 family protein n=1 Tax=Sneathiella chungangensis TaxID=1418234 RepID=A0A845MMS3_9PROT|nr:TIGR02302 family protein [Sneathiella chungangensis]MZR24226.1 TIGR02302 family protein [Sneathiella chungangensis]